MTDHKTPLQVVCTDAHHVTERAGDEAQRAFYLLAMSSLVIALRETSPMIQAQIMERAKRETRKCLEGQPTMEAMMMDLFNLISDDDPNALKRHLKEIRN